MEVFNKYDRDDEDDNAPPGWGVCQEWVEATEILGSELTDQFEITFSEPPVHTCPALYGGRHEESGCIVTVVAKHKYEAEYP
jgi:hypothetical protein